jgi:DNA polymerase III delta subunit
MGLSSSGPQRPLYLLIGEDPFRARLRLAELVTALSSGAATEAGELSSWPRPGLGQLLGVTRHDARVDPPGLIALSGRSQGLFDAPDEKRVVIVENADAIADPSWVTSFPVDSALVLITTERMPSARRRARKSATVPGPGDLASAVEEAGGRVERISPLLPERLLPWIAARAKIQKVTLDAGAARELAAATGPDTDRIEQELAKLATFARGATVTPSDVRGLVSGAIESDVFELTRAVVRRDTRTAIAQLERLLADGQAPQQILALLVWQFRVLLFAAAMRTDADAERAARAIRSSANAIARWQAEARRIGRAEVLRAYESLYATDLAIKQGRTEPETALMLCVLDLCGVPGSEVKDLVVGEPPRR